MQSQPSYLKLAVILGILTAFAPLSIDMYLPGLPTIADDFGVSIAAAQQTLSIFFLGLAIGQLIYGPISDRMGRRGPLLVGCALYAVASIGCIFASSVDQLVALRFAQALGGCAGVVIARSVVRDLFDARESARMYSFLMLVMGLAPVLAPLVGGQLLLAFGWRSIFVVLSAFGVICLLLVMFVLQESLPVNRRKRAGLGEAVRTYVGLLGDGRYMGFALSGGFASAAMFAYISGASFVFIELNGVPPEQFGLLFGINALGLMGAAQLNRWLLERYSGGQILNVALAVTAVSGALLALVTMMNVGGFPLMLVLLFICIASTGMVGPNTMAGAMAPHARQAGSAAALLGAVQFAIGAVAGAMVGFFFNGTALPMAVVIAVCAVSAYLILQFLANREVADPAAA